MIFPVSGVEVNPIVSFAVALIVSFFTSMGGVSGAILLLPFQVSFFKPYRTVGKHYQPSFQHRCNSQWRLSLHQRGANALAPDMGGNYRHFTGCFQM
jgi:hypothetical protein